MAQLSEEQARQLRKQMSPECMADIAAHRTSIAKFKTNEKKHSFDSAYAAYAAERQAAKGCSLKNLPADALDKCKDIDFASLYPVPFGTGKPQTATL